MKYGVFSLLECGADNQSDDLSTQLLKCSTVREMKEVLIPHVKRIVKKYEDCCYGTITTTIISFKNEIYKLEQTVNNISQFGIGTIDRIVKDILEH